MDFRDRYRITIFFIGVCFIFLLFQLGSIQLFSEKYKTRADQTTIFRKDLEPSRGMIYDRNNKLLIANDPNYELQVIYNQLDPDMDTTFFCSLLSIPKEEFSKLITRDWNDVKYRKNLPFTFLSGIPPEDFLKFQEHLFRFPGFYPVLNFKRKYVYPNAAHVLGYIGEVSTSRINSDPEKYAIGDYVGVSGMEKVYDGFLKGQKGIAYILKDNIGREINSEDHNLIEQKAIPGTDITSTLDIELQAYGEELMHNKTGSIVAIEPKSGEILSIISSPTYDPNDLAIGRNRGEAYRVLQSDSLNKPLLDRSVIAQYPPGSIFKPILSLIALQEAITYPNRTIRCTGVYDVNKEKGYSQGCRNHPTPYNIEKALEYSCNTYYYKLLAETVEKYGYNNPGKGLAMIDEYLLKFGMGRSLGSDLSNENTGFIPTPEYYDRLYHDIHNGWRASYILSLGIGQGEIQMTTLQMANIAAILANRGYYKTPHIIKAIENGEETNPLFSIINSVDIDSRHFEPVLNGMESVMISGTGRFSNIRDIPTCGKTGTSQNPFGEDHSVFLAFAPKDNPQIAVAVYVENAGGGGAVAAPIGSLMIEKFIKREIPTNRKYVENYVKSINLIPTP